MKRFVSISFYVLFTMTAFLPFLTLIFAFAGYFFEFKAGEKFIVLTAVISLVTAISCIFEKNRLHSYPFITIDI